MGHRASDAKHIEARPRNGDAVGRSGAHREERFAATRSGKGDWRLCALVGPAVGTT